MPAPSRGDVRGALQRRAERGYFEDTEGREEGPGQFVGLLAAVVGRPYGPRGLAHETRGAALVAEHRAPAADLDGTAVREAAHRDGSGAGDQADPLVQARGGHEQFGVADDQRGRVEVQLESGTYLGALARGLAGVAAHGDRGGACARRQCLGDQGGQPAGCGHGVVGPPATACPHVVGDGLVPDAGTQMCLGAAHVDADHEGGEVLHGTSFVVALGCDGGRTVPGQGELGNPGHRGVGELGKPRDGLLTDTAGEYREVR